jgi:hypothetical protein
LRYELFSRILIGDRVSRFRHFLPARAQDRRDLALIAGLSRTD